MGDTGDMKPKKKMKMSKKDEAAGAAFFAVKVISKTYGISFEKLVEALEKMCEGKGKPLEFY